MTTSTAPASTVSVPVVPAERPAVAGPQARTVRPAPAGRAARSRTMRTQRLVPLRSAMPLQLVTLRHTVPMHLRGIDPRDLTSTTPQVPAEQAGETTAGKGGEAR